MLIGLTTAKKHLRVEGPEEDDLITLWIGAAERSAANFLGRKIYADQTVLDAAADADGIVINDTIKAAVLLILGSLYANREDVVTGISVADLPNGSKYLLQPDRIGMGV